MPEPAKVAAAGAAPEGAQDERTAAAAVREMFSAVAPRYDLLNHLLSLNVDRLWWRRAAHSFAPILARPDARVLDLCCGTGDLALALRRETRDHLPPILAADFSHAMLERATRKFRGRNLSALEADALRLPFPDSSFDLVVSAFGFRNLANYETGLREMLRILRPEGECGILEFHEPRGFTGAVYGLYYRRVLPVVAARGAHLLRHLAASRGARPRPLLRDG